MSEAPVSTPAEASFTPAQHLLSLQQRAGNRAVSRLARQLHGGSRVLQRMPIAEYGYAARASAASFRRDHLAANEAGAKSVSENGAGDDRGIDTNTGLIGDEDTIKELVLAADYDSAVKVSGNVWRVPITYPFRIVRIAMNPTTGCNIVRQVGEEEAGEVWVKVYFDEPALKISLTGVWG